MKRPKFLSGGPNLPDKRFPTIVLTPTVEKILAEAGYQASADPLFKEVTALWTNGHHSESGILWRETTGHSTSDLLDWLADNGLAVPEGE